MNKFITLLEAMKININSTLSQGTIEKIQVNKKDLSVTISLLFPVVIDVEDAEVLLQTIEKYFIEVFLYKEAKVIFNYENPNLRNEVLEHYFNYVVNSKNILKPRFLSYENFSKSFDKNEVNIFVADSNEEAMLSPLNDEIREDFIRYGLKVSLKTIVSSFEVPLQKQIDKTIEEQTKQVMHEQEIYEKLVEKNKHLGPNNSKEKGKEFIIKYRRRNSDEPTPLNLVPSSEVARLEHHQKFGNSNFLVVGDIIKASITKQSKEGREFYIYQATVSDGNDSLYIKTFVNPNQLADYEQIAVPGKRISAQGYLNYDRYSNDMVLVLKSFQVLSDASIVERLDNEPLRRVELHAHTKMTAQDSVMNVEDYVNQALKFKHTALAVTDLHNIHVFPDFYNATKDSDILPIFGVEGALVDEAKFKITLEEGTADLKTATYVVYDFETTGLSSNYNEIIEIAAVKIRNNQIIAEFNEYVKPTKAITPFITKLTSITNDDVRFADAIEVVLPKFTNFIKGCILVAHNATFDNSHLYANLKRLGIYEGNYLTIDTLQLARMRYNHKLKAFNLKAVAKYFDVELQQHHRAIYDAKATGNIFLRMLNDLFEAKVTRYEDINKLIDPNEAYKYIFSSLFTILVQDEVGKKNLYKIITDSHTIHYHKEPLMLRSFLQEHRKGLIFGSGCMRGEVFTTAYEKNDEELKKVMSFYDFIEVQPPKIYEVLVERNQDPDVKLYIKDTIDRIIACADELGLLVVATGDVYHLHKEDLRLRDVYINAPLLGGGIHYLANIKNVPSAHFMNTEEMLNEFAFLGDDKAREIVITNTNKIAAQIKKFPLFPDKLFAPSDDFLKERGIASAKAEVTKMTYDNAYLRYGKVLPKYILDRIEKELNSILGNNFASIYYISYLLVKHSVDAGYIVGSRGSVGSSFVAYLMDITEVNPLPPHYTCPNCHFTAIKLRESEKKIYTRSPEETHFDQALNSVDTGYDLPENRCPHCQTMMKMGGVDIPFETFLGFKGEKTPDIDLNFSGEYQSKAHEFCREIFGLDHAFRAGTISTIAERMAEDYVIKYFQKKEMEVRKAEINRIASKIMGSKRSTGQHPGGIVVIPQEIDYTDIIPIQNPADEVDSSFRTTHYDYHKFENNLLKLDILGHDDPTMIRHLMDFVKLYPDEFPFKTVDEIPLTDKNVFGLFTGLQSMGLSSEQVAGEKIGTTGLPEFGTATTKKMLEEINLQTFSDLLKVSGLSHGTDVWNGNARDFLLGLRNDYPTVPFKNLIGCRDDIMVYLIDKLLPPGDAFKIMESVRKGKGVSNDFEKEMLSYNVPKWYIESCKLIKYMFPKAHATAYVIMALRIGWFKIYAPIFYYAAYFSRRAKSFDVEVVLKGHAEINRKVLEYNVKIHNRLANDKDKNTHYALLVALEMVARGYRFVKMDIAKSDANNFQVSKDRQALLIPFSALDSLGEATAISIVEARKESPFTSKRDVMRRTKLNATLFARMEELGVFGNLPEDDQLGLF